MQRVSAWCNIINTCGLVRACGWVQIRCAIPVRRKHVDMLRTHGHRCLSRSTGNRRLVLLTPVHVMVSDANTSIMTDLRQHQTHQNQLFHSGRTRRAPTHSKIPTGLQPASARIVAAASMSQLLLFSWQNPGPGRPLDSYLALFSVAQSRCSSNLSAQASRPLLIWPGYSLRLPIS
jgi:hypothetical protein